MTTLINKNDFKTIKTDKPTTYPKDKWLVYIGSELITDNGDETTTDNFPLKYRKGVNEVETEGLFNICDGINMMIQDEMNIVDENIENERISIESFKGYKYKLTTSASVLDTTSPFHSLTILGIIDKNEATPIYNESTGNIETIISYWNEIKDVFLTTITENPLTFSLEINPIK